MAGVLAWTLRDFDAGPTARYDTREEHYGLYRADGSLKPAAAFFKAYDAAFVRQVGIDSRAGFEVAIELVAKAKRSRLPVVEIPTIWLDRSEGESNFKVRAWLPKYLFWYGFAFGRAVPADQVGPLARGRVCESA